MPTRNKNKKSIIETHPEIAKEWSRKNTRKASEFTYGSEYNAIWECKMGHEWIGSICRRIRTNSKCRFCSNRKVCEDNCLANKFPNLLDEWDYKRNIGINPEDILFNSSKYVYWICKFGHSYKTRICRRTIENTGCRKCMAKYKNKSLLFIENAPIEIINDWDFTKNLNIDINRIKLKSSEIISWKGAICGHEWRASIDKRISRGDSCPYCQNFKVDINNCLATLNPELITEWDYGKNFPFTPFDVVPGSNKKVWWKCKNQHSWQTIIAKRAIRGHKCIACNSSKEQLIVENVIREIFPNEEILINKTYDNLRFKKTNIKMQLDIFLPNLDFAIEYQGQSHYLPVYGQKELQNKKIRDNEKLEKCIENGIHLLQIPYTTIKNTNLIKSVIVNFLKDNNICMNLN